MGLFDDFIEAREQEMAERREALSDMTEKELLIEIVLLLEDIKHRQFLYND